ncbi:MAG: cytochrome c oxidase subunit [Actinomycetota bacterium]|jgi:cytochrome c oxidase subunit 2|nr:cytochrome c oxidase subunit [Actinomycetota bacterium]
MTPRRHGGRRLVLAAVAGLVLVLAGCSGVKNNGQNSLEPKGKQAQKIDNLFVPWLIVAIVIGIAIIVATVFLALKFRYREGKNENPKQIHGNTKLEIGWTILPALLLAIVAVPTVGTIFDLAQNPGPQALQITVEGKQWWWQFSYPDAKVVTADEMVIPTGRDVFLKLTACDGTGTAKTCNVIHSFWVPELSGKKDVVPGHDNTLTISADKPGTYLGQCAEYCGLSHANMRFRVIAKSPADFQQWLTEQQQGPVNALLASDGTTPAGPTQQLIVKTFQCTNCHSFDDSSKATYGPNLTHLASRTTFASGAYPLTKDNLVNWVKDAPSMIPMSSQGCRLPPGQGICVGMPSFTKNTPPGMQSMTQTQAQDIADFLLGQK